MEKGRKEKENKEHEVNHTVAVQGVQEVPAPHMVSVLPV